MPDCFFSSREATSSQTLLTGSTRLSGNGSAATLVFSPSTPSALRAPDGFAVALVRVQAHHPDRGQPSRSPLAGPPGQQPGRARPDRSALSRSWPRTRNRDTPRPACSTTPSPGPTPPPARRATPPGASRLLDNPTTTRTSEAPTTTVNPHKNPDPSFIEKTPYTRVLMSGRIIGSRQRRALRPRPTCPRARRADDRQHLRGGEADRCSVLLMGCSRPDGDPLPAAR